MVGESKEGRNRRHGPPSPDWRCTAQLERRSCSVEQFGGNGPNGVAEGGPEWGPPCPKTRHPHSLCHERWSGPEGHGPQGGLAPFPVIRAHFGPISAHWVQGTNCGSLEAVKRPAAGAPKGVWAPTRASWRVSRTGTHHPGLCSGHTESWPTYWAGSLLLVFVRSGGSTPDPTPLARQSGDPAGYCPLPC